MTTQQTSSIYLHNAGLIIGSALPIVIGDLVICMPEEWDAFICDYLAAAPLERLKEAQENDS